MLHFFLLRASYAAAILAAASSVFAADPNADAIKKLILPGEAFRIEGRPAFIFWPSEEKRATPQPWVMYAPTLPGLPDSHEKWMHEQFLAAGVAVTGIDAGEAYGSPAGQKLMTALHTELTTKRNFAPKPCLLGRSRGGLWISSWAIANPDQVAGLAGIYPVFDLRSYPGLNRAAPAFGLTAAELEKNLATHNPVARAGELAKAKIPVCIIHGDSDKVVPLKENSAALTDAYKAAGLAGQVELIVPEGQGHNYWEGFFRCQPLIDFAIRRAKAGAEKPAKGSVGVRSTTPLTPTFAARNPTLVSTLFETQAAPAAPATAPTKRDDPVAKIAATLEPTRKLTYKKVGDRELTMHLFEPAGWKATDQRPCFLVIHGGGWSGGEPRRMYPFADHFAKLGCVGISLQYRLLNAKTGVTVFDCVKDGRSAVRYLRANAASLGIDPQKIIVSGGSAGGHVAAGTALFNGVDEADDPANISSVPNALVLLYPVIDTSREGYGNSKIGERWRDLSPAHQVRGNVPPTIVFHGTGDTVTPFAGAKLFHEAMVKAGNRCELDVNEGGKHGYLMFDATLYRDTLTKTEKFLASLKLLPTKSE